MTKIFEFNWIVIVIKRNERKVSEGGKRALSLRMVYEVRFT